MVCVLWRATLECKAFQQLARHDPPLQCETYEVHGTLAQDQRDGDGNNDAT